MVRAVILDFDGTLVTKDILDVICGIVGKEQKSSQINKNFHSGIVPGNTSLVTRINFLHDVTLSQIEKKLDENAYIQKGAKELLDYLVQHNILSILCSGNITPILLYYQKLLGINYVIGTQVKMDGDMIIGISEDKFPVENFKVVGAKRILEKLSIAPNEVLAIGDSPADKKMFEFVGTSIAIHPINGIEKSATYIIENDLANAIPIIEKLCTT